MSEAAEQVDAPEEPEVEARSAAKAQAIDQALDEGDRDSLHTFAVAADESAVPFAGENA